MFNIILVGNYRAVAQNPKTGERVETSAPLFVRGDSMPVDRTAFVAPDAFRTLEMGPNQRPIVIEPGVDTNSFLTPEILQALEQGKPKQIESTEQQKPMSPPKVVVPLKPITCNEGQPIIFTAKVIGNPQPTVSNMQEI